MNKEKLTLENVKQDLYTYLCNQSSNKENLRMSYIIPITLSAILLGILFKNVFIGLLVFSFSGYQIYYYIVETREYKEKEKAILAVIERGEISISTETFSHIANHVIYEPHGVGRRSRVTKTITLYHFNGGSSWRVPLFAKHYEWSKEYYVSSKGLENISIKGDEFYFVSLQAHPDIAYIYPCKNFELDKSLEK